MGKIKEKFKKIYKKLRRYYRKRKLYKYAEIDASIMCGNFFRLLPPEVYIEGDKETMLRETRRALHDVRKKYGNGGIASRTDEKTEAENPTAE